MKRLLVYSLICSFFLPDLLHFVQVVLMMLMDCKYQIDSLLDSDLDFILTIAEHSPCYFTSHVLFYSYAYDHDPAER